MSQGAGGAPHLARWGDIGQVLSPDRSAVVTVALRWSMAAAGPSDLAVQQESKMRRSALGRRASSYGHIESSKCPCRSPAGGSNG